MTIKIFFFFIKKKKKKNKKKKKKKIKNKYFTSFEYNVVKIIKY